MTASKLKVCGKLLLTIFFTIYSVVRVFYGKSGIKTDGAWKSACSESIGSSLQTHQGVKEVAYCFHCCFAQIHTDLLCIVQTCVIFDIEERAIYVREDGKGRPKKHELRDA